MIDKKDPLEYTEEELKKCSTELLKTLLDECETLELQHNTEQMMLKLLINSLYGALANKWFPLFNEKMAQAITGNGRYFIRKLANYVESTLQKLNKSDKPYILSGDTDSIYYTIEPFMLMYQQKNPNLSMNEYVDWADKFEKKVIKPCVQRCIDDFCEELNAYNKDLIGAEREIISDRGVIAEKKKYFMRVRDSEGVRYPENAPYIKIMGLDAIKSSTPAWSKTKLNDAIPKILDSTETDLTNWIKEIKQEFKNANINDIAIIGGVSNLDYKLGDKGIPIGARSCLVHNEYVKTHGLDSTYAMLQPGEKGKRVFLTTPNKLNSEVVQFQHPRFAEEITENMDYDTQFQKGFLNMLKLMTNCLNYNLERETETFDDW